MFRDGQYLEVIKASDNCLASVVVTVQEKTVEIKKKKVATNKWLDVEDWAALYKILKRALEQNCQHDKSSKEVEGCEWKKSTRQLDVTYTFEPSNDSQDVTSLPTIRVNVSPAGKKSSKKEGEDRKHDSSKKLKKQSVAKVEKTQNSCASEKTQGRSLEEYIPDAPSTKKICPDLKYVPSRKSTLGNMQISVNEYSPTVKSVEMTKEVIGYIPNSVNTAGVTYETYEPYIASTAFADSSTEYVPTSKNAKATVEEYEPDFTSKAMKFDNSYVPSGMKCSNVNTKQSSKKLQRLKQESRRKVLPSSKEKKCLSS